MCHSCPSVVALGCALLTQGVCVCVCVSIIVISKNVRKGIVSFDPSHETMSKATVKYLVMDWLC